MSHDHSKGGNSGSFFFFTEDNKFIIKTVNKREMETLIAFLPNMTDFLLQTGGKSLISRIYGLYKVQYSGITPIYLAVQRNNIRVEENNKIQSVFDLKGSKFCRRELKNEEIQYLFRNENHDRVKEKLKNIDGNISMSTSYNRLLLSSNASNRRSSSRHDLKSKSMMLRKDTGSKTATKRQMKRIRSIGKHNQEAQK